MSNSKSFTLLEVIVAIFLVTVGTGGAFALIQRTTSFTAITSSQLTAAYLAQEGIEAIRNMRDSNWLAGNNWNLGINEGSSHALDYQSDNFPDLACSLGGEGFLKRDGSFYNCRTGQDTNFRREINVSYPQPNEMEVQVVVRWFERGRDHSVMARTKLYNWVWKE